MVGLSFLVCVGGVAVSLSVVAVSVGGCRRVVVCQRFCAAGAVLIPPHRFIFSWENLHLLPDVQPPLLKKKLQGASRVGPRRLSRDW